MNRYIRLAALMMAAVIFAACPGSGVKELRPKPKNDFGVDFRKLSGGWKVNNSSTKTPAGSFLHSSLGTPTSEELAAVDRGIKIALDAARESNYSKDQRSYEPGFYHVFFPENPCVRSKETGVLAFLLRADNYDGMWPDQANSLGEETDPVKREQGYVYVKDGIGVVLAPEAVGSLGTPGSTLDYGEIYVCREGDIQTLTRFGAEHIKIANENTAYFQATMTHSGQDSPGVRGGHPLLPQPEAPPPALLSPRMDPIAAINIQNGVIPIK